jgi:hypothetical protein
MRENMGEIRVRLAVRVVETPHGRLQKDLLDEEGEEAETFSQRHTEDGLNEDLAGGGGITADSFSGFGADKTDSDGGGDKTGGARDTTSDFCEDHVMGGLVVFVRSLSRAHLLDTCSRL